MERDISEKVELWRQHALVLEGLPSHKEGCGVRATLSVKGCSNRAAT